MINKKDNNLICKFCLREDPKTLVPEWISVFYNLLEYSKNNPSMKGFYYIIIIINKENKVSVLAKEYNELISSIG